MPIKDKGFHAFVGAWAAKVVPLDFWVGLRGKTVTRTYSDQEPINPLVEDSAPSFSYAGVSAINICRFVRGNFVAQL